MKILIVDDDQLTATTWALGLKSAGMEVVTASSGQEGINQAKAQMPNLVLLDQIMPDMLGNAVLTTLKGDPATAGIPVMLISNYNESQMMKEAIEKGAIDYILKYQIETKDLVEKVKTIMAELAVTAPPPIESTPAEPSVNQPVQSSTPTPTIESPEEKTQTE